MGMRDVRSIAEDHHGLLTRQQALRVVTPKQLRGACDRGELERMGRDVFRVTGSPPGPRVPIAAAVLAAGPIGAASHRSGVELHGWSGVSTGRPEVLVLRPRELRIPGVTVHTTNLLPPEHVTTVDGIPVTTPARTLFDASAVVGPRMLARLVDAAVRARATTVEELWAVHDFLTGRGRRRSVWFRSVLDAWGDGVKPGDSPREVDVARLLVGAGLPRPVQLHPVTVGGTVHVLDLAWPDVMLDVEYDGWDAHGGRLSFDGDCQRDAELTAAGWTVLRFTNASSERTIVGTVRAAYDRLFRADCTSEGGIRGKIAG